MGTNFISDFSLFPIKKTGHPGWEFRKATWPSEIDAQVHKLYNNEITTEVYYDRLKIRDGTTERCKIYKNDNDEIIVEPPNKFNYLVRIDSLNNIIKDDVINTSNNNNNVLQHLDCVICYTNKRTHIIKECNHLIMCQECSIAIFNSDKKCPMCRTEMTSPAKKVFF
jgi:hypothetical protein